MTQTKPTRLRSQGRIFPKYSIPPEELDKREAEKHTRVKRYREIFEQASSQLIQDHYNWFIVIDPQSGDYFIDPGEEVAVHKARLKYPNGMVGIMRLNETGTCGRM
ncbi:MULTISPECIES: hypothetical protein [Nostocales]|uniref:Uncharacterized protein n=3 Tax=Nostocales TaxID=1161 RepID=A0A0C1QUB4_9CYAN|nr:hypothetical protein [Tolypothrix bouteillei]KAF3889134.1 hypothetical protein DA73_0400029380 [Tolypothrix bouteillei VB521301]